MQDTWPVVSILVSFRRGKEENRQEEGQRASHGCKEQLMQRGSGCTLQHSSSAQAASASYLCLCHPEPCPCRPVCAPIAAGQGHAPEHPADALRQRQRRPAGAHGGHRRRRDWPGLDRRHGRCAGSPGSQPGGAGEDNRPIRPRLQPCCAWTPGSTANACICVRGNRTGVQGAALTRLLLLLQCVPRSCANSHR